tara:strand:- start:2684 stop:3337 length:654 start_codon:yes stop_codon:yes gene_type:complete
LSAFIFFATSSRAPLALAGRDLVSVSNGMLSAAPPLEAFGAGATAFGAGEAAATRLIGSAAFDGEAGGGAGALTEGAVTAGGGGGTMAAVLVVDLGAAGITMSGIFVAVLAAIFSGAFAAACGAALIALGSGAVMATFAGGATIGAGVRATFGALGTGVATRDGAGTLGLVTLGAVVAGAALLIVLRAVGNVGCRGALALGNAAALAGAAAMAGRRV